MTIFKSIVRKEFLKLLRDARTLLIVLVMPMVLLLLFGFAISTDVNDVRVAAVVSNHTDRTRDILLRMQTNPYFTFTGLAQHGDIDRLLRTSQADAVVVLETRNGQLRSQIVTDGSNTTLAQAAQAYISQLIAGPGQPSPIIGHVLYNPQLKSAYNFVPGILGLIFLLICGIMTSVSIVSERQSGTMDLLLVSPIRPRTVITGKLVPYFLLSCLILTLMLALSYTVLGIPFSAKAVDVVLISMLYIALALSIGLLVSTLVKTEVAALIVSAIGFMIPVIMLSGMIFPIDNMPEVLQWFSCVVPARWYIAAMRKLMIQQLPLEYVATEVSVLTGMTLLIFMLAVRKFKNQK